MTSLFYYFGKFCKNLLVCLTKSRGEKIFWKNFRHLDTVLFRSGYGGYCENFQKFISSANVPYPLKYFSIFSHFFYWIRWIPLNFRSGYGTFFQLDTVDTLIFSVRYKYIIPENICQIDKMYSYDTKQGFFRSVYPYERHCGYGWIRWLCKTLYIYFLFCYIFSVYSLRNKKILLFLIKVPYPPYPDRTYNFRNKVK